MAERDTLVEAQQRHTRTEEPIGGERRVFAGERYLTTQGLAQRRERHGLVEVLGTKPVKPASAPENKAEELALEDKGPGLGSAEGSPSTPAEPVEGASEPPEASAAAEELAEEEGIDLGQVEGTGKDGRILKSDVEEAAEE